MKQRFASEDDPLMIIARKQAELSRCKKMRTGACLVTKRGEFATGNNDLGKNIRECPRKNLPTGEGYELCKKICKQKCHAEVSVLENAKKAGLDTAGSIVYLYGHWYCCQPCIGAMKRTGVKACFVLPEGFYKQEIERREKGSTL